METKSVGLYSTCSPSLQLLVPLLLTSLLFVPNVQNSSAAAITTTKTSKTTYTMYLKTACNTTICPKLCYSSLSPYTSTIKTNDLRLCKAALTLKVAKKTSALIKTPSRQKGLSKPEVGVVQDCQDEIGDSIDELKQALQALGSLKGTNNNVEFQIADIKTWVSAAITDESGCTDGFDGLKVSTTLKNKIRNIISKFNGLTSNALALINKLDQ
ncbi:hypothetical protein P3X46_023686 [Hevea brasiliensis]|uniref:Pectinesterase inhibitor domain-containing protein n=2 Tax=Hevea brasiliensis TaxID=3981 RepID=A0ABQ9LDP4_HEVBR|nr:hypothetical protein P3X46_023686 [Hevea brasiliensis]